MINPSMIKKMKIILLITFFSVSSVAVADNLNPDLFKPCDQQDYRYLEKQINQKIKSMKPEAARAYVMAHAPALAQAKLCTYQEEQNRKKQLLQDNRDNPNAVIGFSVQPQTVVQGGQS